MLPTLFCFSLILVTGSLNALEARWVAEEEAKVVSYNTVNLTTHCLLKLVKNSDHLAKALKTMPSELLVSLLPLMHAQERANIERKHMKRGGPMKRPLNGVDLDVQAKKVLLDFLQDVVDSDDVSLQNACVLCSLKRKLDFSSLRQPLLNAVAHNGILSEAMIETLARSLNADEIAEKPFLELVNLYGGNHPQKNEVTTAFIREHLREIKPVSEIWSCFRITEYENKPPLPALALWDNPFLAFYGNSCTTADIFRDDKVTPVISLDTRSAGYKDPRGYNPATISKDHKFLAICGGAEIDIYLLPQKIGDPFVHDKSKKQILSLKLPEHCIYRVNNLAFAHDNSCLSVEMGSGEKIFFMLPSYYLQFSFTFEQILFLRLLTIGFTKEQGLNGITACYNLDKCGVVASFPETEARLFRQLIYKMLLAYRVQRQSALQQASKNFEAALHTYFYPAELRLLRTDLSGIKSTRLQKKITKKMVAALKEAHPQKDFTAMLKISDASLEEDIKKNIQSAWDEYQTLQDPKKPEEFKHHFITLMTESYNRCQAIK